MPSQAAENFIVRAPEADPPALSSHPAPSVPDFAGFLPPVSNTTFTPNQFFDVCLPHCSRSAVRVVAYFLRRTLGWCDQYGRPQEEQIEISFRELAAKAGVSRDRLRAALDEAIAGHFLECVREGRPNRAHEAGQSALYRLCWHDSAGYEKDPAAFRGFFEREGNRTDIPNQFFDHIVPNEPLSVIKVVGSIIRSSIGFEARRGARRQWASLSYTQIQNFTRLASRKELATALRTALVRRYIVRLEAGRFTHEKAEQRSAVYALRWADGWSGNPGVFCKRRGFSCGLRLIGCAGGMNDKEFFYRVLGLEEPWLVEEVKLDLGGKKVEVRVAVKPGTKWGEDGKLLPIAGYEERSWRHLDTMQLETIITARVPRVSWIEESEQGGRKTTKMVRVPWAEPGSRWTLAFEAFAVQVLTACGSTNQAAEWLRLDWRSVNRIMERAVERGLAVSPSATASGEARGGRGYWRA